MKNSITIIPPSRPESVALNTKVNRELKESVQREAKARGNNLREVIEHLFAVYLEQCSKEKRK